MRIHLFITFISLGFGLLNQSCAMAENSKAQDQTQQDQTQQDQTQQDQTQQDQTPQDQAAQNKKTLKIPCSTSEYRQLDFWVGDWELSWDLPNGDIGKGRNLVTASDFGNCVITENFSMPGFTGMSVSTYDTNLEKWRQTWVDDQGGYFALIGGPSDGVDYDFELIVSRPSEKSPHLRMIWQDVSSDALIWRWQKRIPNPEGDGDHAWKDQWVITYKRRET